MKILITGAAGFIGANLVEFFLAKDYTIVGIDNYATGFEHNIYPFLAHPNFTFVHCDIRDLKKLSELTKGVDYILHQAALGSVPRSINDPLTSNEVNVNGFLNILECARENKVKRVVYAASSSTYGDSKSLPKVEDVIGKPLSPYAITKYVNELYADVYAKTYGIETIGLRYFNVFGRRQTPNGAYAAVIPKFIGLFLNSESPVINGDGNYSRDFTYIDNVLQMNHLAMTTQNPKAVNQVYNTAVGDRVTIREMAETIKKGLAVYDEKIPEITINYGPIRDGDVPHSQASIDKAKKLLDYQPTHNFFQGIEASLAWYYKNLRK